MRDMTQGDRPHRRGLVLEGGGGKGAYALGCLLAFSEKNIRFDAVSGASVGALNAALWSAEKLAEGKMFYEGLTMGSVFKLSRPITFAALLMLINIVPYSLAKAVHPQAILVALSGAILMLLFTALAILWDSLFDGVAFYEALDKYKLGFLFTGAFGFVFGFLTLPYILRAKGFSLLKTDPLRQMIVDTVGSATFTVPTYATLTRETYIADPDTPYFVPVREAPLPMLDIMANLTPDKHLIPEYLRLDSIPKGQLIEVLLGSTALPYNIFPEVYLNERYYVDGGVVDNLPIYPLVVDTPCDEIVIIHLRPLRPNKEERLKAYKERCRKIDRLLRLANLPESKKAEILQDKVYKARHEITFSVPLLDLPFWPHKVIEIAPRRRLGTFVTGTMNFRGEQAKKWVELGYQDALAVIRGHWPAA